MSPRALLRCALLLAACGLGQAEERFPPPEFSATEYRLPSAERPPAEAPWRDWADLGTLACALALSTWLVLKRRSRRGVYALMLFSIAWFGFYRGGCICPIGGIQNVSQALADPGFALPLAALGFFLLPLVATLLFGRTYCAAVCPHGALQDAVLLRPLQVPPWLEHALGLLAYLYLGLAVLCSATGAAYLICEYDPFVPLFRLSGSLNMLLLGGLFLLAGLFVGRPYCRFLCPYGALLRLLSRLSRWRVLIYPDRCIDCRLCDTSCPYGAIRKSTPATAAPARPPARRRLAAFLALLPCLVLAGAWGGSRLAGSLARIHPGVRLERLIRLEAAGPLSAPSEELAAFRQSGRPAAEVALEAAGIQARFERGALWFGAWMGLVIGLKLVSLSLWKGRREYEADRAKCLGCARCFEYCPGEAGLLDPALAAGVPRP